jgi:2-amino-4-hydroxy-6-hydroxymethyldihydropteridine diphosphokinase
MGDREEHLGRAVAGLPDLVAVSPVYETAPVGGPPGQEMYLNLVVELETQLTARGLLELAHRMEQEGGRVRTVRHGPRTLDVDVLLVGDLVVDEPDLVVPHPRMWERRFVVEPLADLAPDLVPPSVRIASGGEVRRLGMLRGY